MSIEPLVSQQVKTPNKFLWAVKSYIDLISRMDALVYGSGLKRLYVMASGVATFNESDIEAIVAKSERTKILPESLNGFLNACVLKNIELYGKELQRMINERIVAIANGDVRNPDPLYKFSADEARRHYYTPPNPLVLRILKALEQDHGMDNLKWMPSISLTINDVANDVDITMTRMQLDEGHLTQTQTAWGALIKAVEGLVERLERETRLASTDRDYRKSARGTLKILWFVAKVLMGDLTIRPLAKDINQIDLQQKLSFTDGTLAAIPFPLPGTIELFQDNDHNGLSMKGRMYLSAVSAASFYRGAPSEDY